MNETQGQPSSNHSLVWVIGVLIALILIVGTVIFFLWRDKDAESTNTTQNANSAVNTALRNSNGNNTNASANVNAPFVDAEIGYTNPQFGYTVRYNDPDRSRITTSVSDTAHNLYHEWTLEDGVQVVIAVDVYPNDKVTEVFSEKGYAVLDEAVELGSVAGKVLTINGARKGYRVEYGNYTFVLRTDGEPGSSVAKEFETIAKSFVF
jgi:hypothetical protein